MAFLANEVPFVCRIFNATLRQAKNERFFTSNFKGSQLAAQYVVPGAAHWLKITQNVAFDSILELSFRFSKIR